MSDKVLSQFKPETHEENTIDCSLQAEIRHHRYRMDSRIPCGSAEADA